MRRMTGQATAEGSPCSHRLSVKSQKDEQDRAESVLSRRSQSVCDDTSSELQRVAALEPQDGPSRHSFRGRGGLFRLVSLVVILRDWAHKSLIEEEERPDSFLERFRGPEVRAPPSRRSNNQPEANDNTKGTTKYYYRVLTSHSHTWTNTYTC
ncbi:cyclic nucleotide-gated cation channel-like [Paramisgurnus dabryanus]|uniref:cyclic nucleotide-gated cation channel-like n=1 Tax=Paramisgurnus dabryanus TaxID=90735 RepID=UPI0031F3A2C5